MYFSLKHNRPGCGCGEPEGLFGSGCSCCSGGGGRVVAGISTNTRAQIRRTDAGYTHTTETVQLGL
jgi:hypothetical protein